MLHCSFNNRFAFEHSPLRDARLIMFAKADTGEQQTTDEAQETSPKKEQDAAVTATIDKERAETKQDIQSVLESKQAPPPTEETSPQESSTVPKAPVTPGGEEVEKKIEKLRSSLLAAQQKLQGTYQQYKDVMPSEFQHKLLKTDAFLSMQLTALTRWSEALKIIEAFKKREMAPDTFAQWLTENIQKTGIQGKEQEAWKKTIRNLNQMLTRRKKDYSITTLALNKFHGTDRSAMLNQSTRIQIDQEIEKLIQETERIIPFGELTSLIQENIATIEEVFPEEKLNEFNIGVNEIQKKLKEIQDDKTVAQANKKSFFGSIGIRFYSAYEIFEAFSMVTKAYQESFKEHTHLKASGLAQSGGNVARFLPFAGDIQQTLNLQLDKANDEVKDNFVKFLENRRVNFRGLFDPGGELDRNKHDPNRARAVLEYAASRGFLWDIEESDKRTKIVAGIPLETILPSQWTQAQKDAYYDGLRNKNASGQMEEKKKGENLVASAENIPIIIREIQSEMRKRHFWSAFGMMEVAIKKGKVGHVNPWLATTIFMEMRKGDAVKYIPKSFFDQIGGLGLGQPGFTMQFFKVDKNELAVWRERRKSGVDAPIDETGVLGNIIAQIEKEFADVPEEKRAELVAQVLAGQLIRYKGKNISLFESKYNEYRHGILRNPYAGAPNMQVDDDFFAEPSEVILYDGTNIMTILRISNEAFSQQGKAVNFMRNIIDRYDALENAGMTEAMNEFKNDMRIKLHQYLREGPINDVRTTAAGKITVKTKKNIKDGEPALSGMLDRDLIQLKEVEKLIDENHKGKETFLWILKGSKYHDNDRVKAWQKGKSGGKGGEG